MGYEDLRSAVNAYLSQTFGASIAYDQTVADVVAQRAPTFVVVVHRLLAADQADAMKWLEEYTLDVHTILGVSKGNKPKLFATFVVLNGKCEGGFYKDHYRGNLLAPMNPGEIAHQLDRLMPKMNQPRTRLLLQTYAEAMREPDRDFQYLRLWTLLELMAKDAVKGPPRPIADTSGRPILDRDGRQILTKTALSKVYQYLRDLGHGDIRTDRAAIPLWKILGAAYEIRNSVAHEGAFNVAQQAKPGSAKALAIEQRKQSWDLVYDTLKSSAWLSVLRETNKI